MMPHFKNSIQRKDSEKVFELPSFIFLGQFRSLLGQLCNVCEYNEDGGHIS